MTYKPEPSTYIIKITPGSVAEERRLINMLEDMCAYITVEAEAGPDKSKVDVELYEEPII